MLVIRGVNVYPSEIERILLGEPAVAPDYVLVIDERNGGRELIAVCERVTELTADSPSAGRSAPGAGVGVGSGGVRAGGVRAGGAARSEDQLSETLEHRLRETLGLRVRVAIVPPGTVPRTEVGKAVRVRRWSAGDPPVPGLAG
jgi:phenylacetate-CoA ligase